MIDITDPVANHSLVLRKDQALVGGQVDRVSGVVLERETLCVILQCEFWKRITVVLDDDFAVDDEVGGALRKIGRCHGIAVDIAFPANLGSGSDIQFRRYHPNIETIPRPQMKAVRLQGHGFREVILREMTDFYASHVIAV